MIGFSIYARNFLSPPFLEVKSTGHTKLYLGSFYFGKSATKTTSILNRNRRIKPAGIEHFLQMLLMPELFIFSGLGIVCPDATFESPNAEMGIVVPYAIVGDFYSNHQVGLAPQAMFNSRALFLAVSR